MNTVARLSIGIGVSTLLFSGGCATTPPPSAKELNDNEARACAAVTPYDRATDPLTGVERVAPIYSPVSPKPPITPGGVALYLRPTPNLSEPWIGRVIECRRARIEVARARAGSALDDGSILSVPNTSIAVSSTRDGYRIAITSPDPAAARELRRRASTLID